MAPPGIQILSNASLRSESLKSVADRIREIFPLPVVTSRGTLDLRAAYDPSRKQTNSTQLLAQMLSPEEVNEAKRIAVVDVDLFIPILTFVFGEAQLDGPTAVVSTHRLSNQFYGLPRNDALMLQRLEKEIVHELGHTFGLIHCSYFECVMRASTYVEEIDLKSLYPCEACRSSLMIRTGRFASSGG